MDNINVDNINMDNGLITVSGRNWSSRDPYTFTVSADLQKSLYDLLRMGILESLKRYNVDIKEGYEDRAVDHLMTFVQCKLNGREIPRERWKLTVPQKCDYLEFLVAPQGGGRNAGKMIISAVAMIAIAVVAFAAVAATAAAIAGTSFSTAANAMMGAGLTSLSGLGVGGAAASYAVGIAVMAAGSMIVNALTPTPKMKNASDGQADTSPTYSIGSSSNRTNPLGYVPLVLGKFRFHAPLGAKTFSRWTDNKQYYYLLPVWGHCDIGVYDIRIGETPLADYGALTVKKELSTDGKTVAVQHYGDSEAPIISYHELVTPQNGFVYFGEMFNEQSVGTVIKNKLGWVQRIVGDCDVIKVDFSFASLCKMDKKSGDAVGTDVTFSLQYKDLADPNGKWLPFDGNYVYKGRTYDAIDKECLSGTKVYAWITKEGEYHACSDGDVVSITRTTTPQKIKYKYVVVKEYDVYDDENYYDHTEYDVSYPEKTESIAAWVNDPDSIASIEHVTLQYPDSDSSFSIKVNGGTRLLRSRGDNAQQTYSTLHAPAIKIIKAPATGEIIIGYDKMSNYCVSCYSVVEKNIEIDKHNIAVRIKRITQDRHEDDDYSDDNYKFYDDATWSVVAGINWGIPIKTPTWIRCSEFQIKASESFSGSVNTVNAVCVSDIPIMVEGLHGNYGGWTDLQAYNSATWGKTRNPADILHYLLTNGHAIHEPFTIDRIDEESFYKFWHFCNNNDFKFDLVCDSERNTWELWSAVASAGRGTLTVDRDGKFAVVIDGDVQKVGNTYQLPIPTQMFTPLNSWDFSIERSFYKTPHALRVTYKKDPEADLTAVERKALINKQKNTPQNIIMYADGHAEISSIFESDAFEDREAFIYADYWDETQQKMVQYTAENAEDIVEWSFTGKTRWADLWKMGRYYLAAMRLRPYTATLTTDWEWLMCHRGDVVVVAHDVLMNTFGVARITALVYVGSNGNIFYKTTDDTDDPEGATWTSAAVNCEFTKGGITYTLRAVQIDDTVIFSENNVEYHISFRTYNGDVSSYRLDSSKHPYNSASDVLWLALAIPNNTASKSYVRPYIGCLVSVATAETKEDKYIVASITPAENNTAELSLIPYAIEGIMDSVNDVKQTPYEYTTLKASVGTPKSLPYPTIGAIVSDESLMQIDTKSNDVVYRMRVPINKPTSKVSTSLSNVIMQVHITDTSTKEVRTQTVPYNGNISEVIFTGVKEAQTYQVKTRMTCDEGVTSNWSPIVKHKVVGGTTLPPKATSVALKSTSLYIKLKNAPLDIAGFNIYTGDNEEKLSKIGFFSANLDLTSISKNNTTTCTCYADIEQFISEYTTFYIETVDRGGRLSKERLKINTEKLISADKGAVRVSSTSVANVANGNLYRGVKTTTNNVTTIFPASSTQTRILGA